jgi:hypothetical protein
MTLLRICTITGSALIAVATSLVFLGGRKKTPEQYEMLRRQHLCAQGRITDGTVLDVQEIDSPAGNSVQMILYIYNLAGVQYECSQDVTQLHQFVDPRSCIGGATSVKYDPHNPCNSIVVAETWCGLRP